MPARKRIKTKYPGVYYIEGKTAGSKRKERIYYIIYRKDGKQIEEKAGRQYHNKMTPSRAARIRNECMAGRRLSKKEIKRNNDKGQVEFGGGKNLSERISNAVNPVVHGHSPDQAPIKNVLREESEERYWNLVNLSPDPVLIFQDGLTKMASSAFFTLFGYTQKDIEAGLSPIEFVHERHRERVRSQLEARMAGKDIPKDNRTDLVRKDGTTIPCETSKCLVPYNGRPADLVIVRDITEREKAEQALRERELELDIKNQSLEEMNAALRVLLRKRDEDKKELEEKVLANIKELVIPYLQKLKTSRLNARQKSFISILESNLKDIISPFSLELSSVQLKLTPAEIQISNLIREGKTTKEIAEMLNLSGKTIESHRKNIRKKIGIKNQKENLRTHLLNIHNG